LDTDGVVFRVRGLLAVVLGVVVVEVRGVKRKDTRRVLVVLDVVVHYLNVLFVFTYSVVEILFVILFAFLEAIILVF
jgi:hypothetical protein